MNRPLSVELVSFIVESWSAVVTMATEPRVDEDMVLAAQNEVKVRNMGSAEDVV